MMVDDYATVYVWSYEREVWDREAFIRTEDLEAFLEGMDEYGYTRGTDVCCFPGKLSCRQFTRHGSPL